jgi:uncharacterized CHY-type Zn-finger protein
MAERNNATCSICGKDYYMCMSCKDTIELHPFKKFTDTAEHYKIFQVVRGFSTGVYTKDEAKEKFKNIDLRDIESFRPHIKKVIKDILKEEKPVIKHVETTVVKEKPAVEMDEKMVMSRRKNYKVEVEAE